MSFLEAVFFSCGHEVCHGAVHVAIRKPRYKDFVLALLYFDIFHAYMYKYFKLTHIAHHIQLGKGTLDDTSDGDLVNRASFPAWQQAARAHSNSKEILGYVPRNLFFRVLWHPFYFSTREIVRSLSSLFLSLQHGFFSYSTWCLFITFLPLAFGRYTGLLTLLSCEIFSNSILSPKFCIFMTNHASSFAGSICQPTSSSYGGKIWDWLCFFGNYHVEHHDFPTIPSWRLPELHRKAKRHYASLRHFKGYLDTASRLLTKDLWIYACHN